MQTRENAAATDFEGILEEEVAADLKEVATISMGTEISADDMANITALCDQVGPSGQGEHKSISPCLHGGAPMPLPPQQTAAAAGDYQLRDKERPTDPRSPL